MRGREIKRVSNTMQIRGREREREGVKGGKKKYVCGD